MFDSLPVIFEVQGFLEAGGPIVRVLLVIALILWALILDRILFYWRELPALRASVEERWVQRTDRTSWYARKIKQQFAAETLRRIRGPLPMIKTFVALCPLVGLLGTVTGMIQVFEVMAVLGTGNAREMASGVSAATLPTMAGMVLALSGMYPILRFEQIVQRESRWLEDHLVTH